MGLLVLVFGYCFVNCGWCCFGCLSYDEFVRWCELIFWYLCNFGNFFLFWRDFLVCVFASLFYFSLFSFELLF